MDKKIFIVHSGGLTKGSDAAKVYWIGDETTLKKKKVVFKLEEGAVLISNDNEATYRIATQVERDSYKIDRYIQNGEFV